MSDEAGELVKEAAKIGGGAVGGSLLVWLVQKLAGRAIEREDDEKKKLVAEMELLQRAVSDLANKVSLLLDRDNARQRIEEARERHATEVTVRLSKVETDMAELRATVRMLSEGVAR